MTISNIKRPLAAVLAHPGRLRKQFSNARLGLPGHATHSVAAAGRIEILLRSRAGLARPSQVQKTERADRCRMMARR
jgi:hypothetical protein